MGQFEKLLLSILSGTKDNNIKFKDLQNLLDSFDFDVRIKGDHFIYIRDDIDEIINIQPKGNMAKPYQIKQVRNIIVKYKLGGDLDA